MGKIFVRCARSIKNWRMLLIGEAEELEKCVEELELRSSRAPRITWESHTQGGPSPRSECAALCCNETRGVML
jgi:hypothetical protein